MQRMTVWTADHVPVLGLRDHGLDQDVVALMEGMDPDIRKHLPSVLNGMASSGSAGYSYSSSLPNHEQCTALLTALEGTGIVSQVLGHGGKTIWNLTDSGTTMLRTMHVLRTITDSVALSSRALPPDQLSAYELVMWLDKQKWVQLVLTLRKDF